MARPMPEEAPVTSAVRGAAPGARSRAGCSGLAETRPGGARSATRAAAFSAAQPRVTARTFFCTSGFEVPVASTVASERSPTMRSASPR